MSRSLPFSVWLLLLTLLLLSSSPSFFSPSSFSHLVSAQGFIMEPDSPTVEPHAYVALVNFSLSVAGVRGLIQTILRLLSTLTGGGIEIGHRYEEGCVKGFSFK